MSDYVNYTVTTLMDLIRIRSVAPPGENYIDIVNYISKWLSEFGLNTRVTEVPKGRVREYYPEWGDYPRYIVFAEFCNSKSNKLHFNAHYDVVPGGSGWLVTDPFKPVLINGRVYGRGASDDKGGVAALMLLARRLSRLSEFNGCVEFSFTPDEEIGGLTGVNYLMEVIPKPNYAVVVEPTGLNNIWIGSMGVLQLDVIVRGVSAHASQSWLGINAFEDGVLLAHVLINGLVRDVNDKEFMGERATMVLGGLVSSGVTRNLVPGYFQFSIDRRLLPNEESSFVIREIMNYIDRYKAELNIKSSVDINVVNTIESAMNNKDSPLIKTLINTVRKVLYVEPTLSISRSPVDTRYFQRLGVDSVTYGPGDVTSAHGPDEYINVNDILLASEVYLRLAMSILNG
ncbi:MAG: M20 family metallopeptidase [Vulcanisaeta sp. AZ3]|nr:MAG: acetylornithine deacetylase [Vulcanisaeta sp. AZ3]